MVAASEVDLAEDRPGIRFHRETADLGVVGEDEFPVAAAPDVDLDGIGHGRSRSEARQCVVRDIGRANPGGR